jgi:hypothetical protein
MLPSDSTAWLRTAPPDSADVTRRVPPEEP